MPEYNPTIEAKSEHEFKELRRCFDELPEYIKDNICVVRYNKARHTIDFVYNDIYEKTDSVVTLKFPTPIKIFQRKNQLTILYDHCWIVIPSTNNIFADYVFKNNTDLNKIKFVEYSSKEE